MGELKADWRLRLRRGGADGPVCGAGVLLTRDRALTCAHVVGEPDTRIWVEFAENPAIATIEINPFILWPQGGSAVDVVIEMAAANPQRSEPCRQM